MIKSIRFLQPKFHITQQARNVMQMRHDDSMIYLGLSALQKCVLGESKSKSSFLQKLLNKKRNTTELSYILDVDKDKNFTLLAKRRIGELMITGDAVSLDFKKIVFSKDEVVKTILNSKKGILDQLSKLNNYLKSSR